MGAGSLGDYCEAALEAPPDMDQLMGRLRAASPAGWVPVAARLAGQGRPARRLLLIARPKWNSKGKHYTRYCRMHSRFKHEDPHEYPTNQINWK
jgi:hypothetical protein